MDKIIDIIVDAGGKLLGIVDKLDELVEEYMERRSNRIDERERRDG